MIKIIDIIGKISFIFVCCIAILCALVQTYYQNFFSFGMTLVLTFLIGYLYGDNKQDKGVDKKC